MQASYNEREATVSTPKSTYPFALCAYAVQILLDTCVSDSRSTNTRLSHRCRRDSAMYSPCYFGRCVFLANRG